MGIRPTGLNPMADLQTLLDDGGPMIFVPKGEDGQINEIDRPLQITQDGTHVVFEWGFKLQSIGLSIAQSQIQVEADDVELTIRGCEFEIEANEADARIADRIDIRLKR